MAHAKQEEGSAAAWVADSVASRGAGPAFVGLLCIAVLARAAGGPTHLVSWRVTGLFLAFAGLLLVGHTMERVRTGRPPPLSLFAIQLGLVGLLLWIVSQSRTPGFGLGGHPEPRVLFVASIVILTPVLLGDPRRYGPLQWAAIACFATVTAIFFHHSADIAAESLRSRHPLWWGLLVGLNLIVLPRYLTTRQFLWGLNRLAALVVLLALPIYVVGEYTLFDLRFTFHESFTVPLVEWEIRATRSLFVNRNALGIVVFAGLVAGLDELYRRYQAAPGGPATVVSAGLLAVNVLGFALAYDRKLWLLSPIVLGIYAAAVGYGRDAVPYAIGAGVGAVAGGLLAIYVGVLPIDDKNRFLLWDAGIRAIRHRPLYLGEGLISPGHWLEPFHTMGPVSPHNSYISIWLRTGIVGGVAYVLLVAGSVLAGTLRYRQVDLAVLALAFGFAVHQLFEAYTLFQTGTTSILATLTVGFLLFGHLGGDPDGESSGLPEPAGGPSHRTQGGRAPDGSVPDEHT